ncbi:hypothetical protein LTS17_003212 [Exophiala oligosperma]
MTYAQFTTASVGLVDHTHAVGTKHPSSSCSSSFNTGARISTEPSTHLGLGRFAKLRNVQVGVIRVVQLFIELMSKIRYKHKMRNGKSTEYHYEEISLDDIHGDQEAYAVHNIDEARLMFMVKNMAVLESIKVRGEIKLAFEKYCAMDLDEEGDLVDDHNTGLTLPSTEHIRLKAQNLLNEFANNSLPDLVDIL